jgi:biotin transport system substrate-specific component
MRMLALPRRIDGSLRRAGAVLVGTAILTLSSYVQVPMLPVPMTMQTLAVTLIGATMGRRWGVAAVLTWLAAAFVGLPVLAGDHLTGPGAFVGPTAGYLVSFPFAAALTGWLAERGWNRHLGAAFAAMLAGNALILALGWAWLAGLFGPQTAFAIGIAPFALGGVVKAGIGATTVRLLGK